MNRRRSHSATGGSLDNAERSAVKRDYLQHASPSSTGNSPGRVTDLEFLRSKRRRQDKSSIGLDYATALISHSSPTAPTPSHSLCSSSNKRRNRRGTANSECLLLDHDERPDLDQIRSKAFWELHRSVELNGEGFVNRMRDYEFLRSKSDAYTKAIRGRKRSSVSIPIQTRTNFVQEDEDDVLILAEYCLEPFPRHRKRARSADGGREYNDGRSMSLCGSERSSSPHPSASSSLCASEDESPQASPLCKKSMGSPIPTLSNSTSQSSNSSLTSLSLPPSISLPSTSTFTFRSPYFPATRTEKAIAALSLAMANGAGSINDYECLQSLETVCLLDDCEVGEMWH